MLDESYDKGWKAQLMTVVRFVHRERVQTAYFRLIELTRRHVYYNATRTFIKAGCALSIATAVHDEMQSLNIDLKKLVCFCTDGASAMIGWKGGMDAILKQWCNLFLLHIHCCTHKHLLATEYDVSKPLPAYVEMVMTLMR